MAKVFVIVMLLLIVGSMASALIFMMTDKGQSNRTVKALTVRITLSLLAFVFLWIAYAAGWIKPHGILPANGGQPPVMSRQQSQDPAN